MSDHEWGKNNSRIRTCGCSARKIVAIYMDENGCDGLIEEEEDCHCEVANLFLLGNECPKPWCFPYWKKGVRRERPD